MCDSCREEWGADLIAEVDAFVNKWPNAAYGPAHIVLDDLNLEPEHIRYCLGGIAAERSLRHGETITHPTDPDEARGWIDCARIHAEQPHHFPVYPIDELVATEAFLRELMPKSAGRMIRRPS